MKFSQIKYRRTVNGFGLIELMVAIAIGLILSTALSYFFLGSQKSSRVHDDSSRMQENARNALDMMGRAIRQAGYRANYALPISFAAVSGSNNTSPAADSITVSYEGQDGGESDCADPDPANKVAAGALLTFAFSVNDSLQLTCTNGSGTKVVVADNVENMQITYGIDSLRSGVVTSPYVDLPASGTEFAQVAVVKVVLTMRGKNADVANGGDGYVRQTYSASYTVRNQAG